MLFVMKKSLLFLGLLGLVGSVQAQTGGNRWTVVNMSNAMTSFNYGIDDIHTLSADVVWGLSYDATIPPGSPADYRFKNLTFVRAKGAGGTEFDFDGLNDGMNFGFEGANIVGLSSQVALAAMFRESGTGAGQGGGGQILRTTNGGANWTAVQGRNFASPNGFNNWVHMFDANEGIAFGDPNADATGDIYFELLRTLDGGLTWTRQPKSSVPTHGPNEASLVRSYFALPGTNTIWTSTAIHTPTGGTPSPVRILKSTDRGRTWTSAATPLTAEIRRIAFKDALNGIAFNTTATGDINLMRTSDGGQTWALITPLNSSAGKFYARDIDAVPASGGAPGFYVSVGYSTVPMTGVPLPNEALGSSTSLDGITWQDVDNAVRVNPTTRRVYNCLDVVSSTVGYIGGFTDASNGEGGIYKLNAATPLNALPLLTRTAATESALRAYPNPSAGLFQVRLEEGLKSVTQLTVTDGLGRQVYRRQLTPSTVSSAAISVDLTKEPAGVYIIQLRDAGGVSQKRIVIQ